jgi:hypothetical protein
MCLKELAPESTNAGRRRAATSRMSEGIWRPLHRAFDIMQTPVTAVQESAPLGSAVQDDVLVLQWADGEQSARAKQVPEEGPRRRFTWSLHRSPPAFVPVLC